MVMPEINKARGFTALVGYLARLLRLPVDMSVTIVPFPDSHRNSKGI